MMSLASLMVLGVAGLVAVSLAYSWMMKDSVGNAVALKAFCQPLGCHGPGRETLERSDLCLYRFGLPNFNTPPPTPRARCGPRGVGSARRRLSNRPQGTVCTQ